MSKGIVVAVVVVVVLVVLGVVIGGFVLVGLPMITDFIGGGDDGGGGNETPPAANKAPHAVIEVNNTRVRTAINVSFDGTGSWDTDGNISYYIWDFGDGSGGASGPNAGLVNHSYADAGTYHVNLTVRDDKAATNKTSVTIIVTTQDFHDTFGTVLMSRNNPLLPSNTSFPFEVKEDALRANISISFVGGDFDVDVRIVNSAGTLLVNETDDSILSGRVDLELSEKQLSRTGNYQIEVSCNSGSVYVSGSVDVEY